MKCTRTLKINEILSLAAVYLLDRYEDIVRVSMNPLFDTANCCLEYRDTSQQVNAEARDTPIYADTRPKALL